MDLFEIIKNIKPTEKDMLKKSKRKWDEIAKPYGSLGDFEDIISKIACIYSSENVSLDKSALVIMCADNGVAKHKVTLTDTMVTAIMADNFALKRTSVCVMANYLNTEIFPINIGIGIKMNTEGLINENIMLGTNDMTKESAMPLEECIRAINVGINFVKKLKDDDYNIIITGEMGIGNTTTTSALASVFLDKSIEEVTGLGAGLDKEGLDRKISAIKKAIEINKPDKNNPLDVLSKIGGLDIAGLVGLYLGASYYQIPILIDGVISQISALIAYELNNNCLDYMIASHISDEPSGKYILEKLGLKAFINASMRLGEGTGAMVGLGALKVILETYNKAVKFSEIDINQYIFFDKN